MKKKRFGADALHPVTIKGFVAATRLILCEYSFLELY